MNFADIGKLAKRRRLEVVLIRNPAIIRALTGVNCDNAILQIKAAGTPLPQATFFTDFRYVPMVHRVAPKLACRDIRKFASLLTEKRCLSALTEKRCLSALVEKRRPRRFMRIGYESTISHAQFLAWQEKFPRAKFVDVAKDLAELRAVKTTDEIAGVCAAERLTCEIWKAASARFRAGMTERDMARIIRKMMIERGDGEAFDTIVSIGKNAAECHHEPDDTVWTGREPVLVDMGVKLNGFCSDLTRNLVPRPFKLYSQVYALVREANRAAIAAARPGMTGKALDKVARDVIRKGGFGHCFGHSLGHGVGYEIHEAPFASKKSDMKLKPGMLVTIEPGIYLEDNLGVRIEDLVLITETGCEVLSASAAI